MDIEKIKNKLIQLCIDYDQMIFEGEDIAYCTGVRAGLEMASALIGLEPTEIYDAVEIACSNNLVPRTNEKKAT